MLINKIKTTLWFFYRPKYWVHYFELAKRRIYNLINLKVDPNESFKAFNWAEKHTLSYSDAFKQLGINGTPSGIDNQILEEGKRLAKKCDVLMGGAGHINFIYDVVRLTKAKVVVETGVAYGWSSLAILAAFESSKIDGNLYSVDMPYPRRNNEKFVGIVVPNKLRKNWIIIDKPDITGLPKALKLCKNMTDVCHYDSDKSRRGRERSYPLLWDSLKSGGLFISDDISGNLCFSEFVKKNQPVKFAVLKVEHNHYAGVIRKP